MGTGENQSYERTQARLFAVLSFHEGKTWSHRRLITPGGTPRTVNAIARGQLTFSASSAELNGYLAATQSLRFAGNLPWLADEPHGPTVNTGRLTSMFVREPWWKGEHASVPAD